jgi:uncharacterized protein (DUF983 family)
LTTAGAANPFLAGALGRCPNCGNGPLFAGFLSLVPVCSVCAYRLAAADSGDGPAVFVIMIVGFLVVFSALFTEVAYHPPVWLHLVTWLPLGAALSLAFLRPIKGLMIAAQIRNKASQHRRDEGSDPGGSDPA